MDRLEREDLNLLCTSTQIMLHRRQNIRSDQPPLFREPSRKKIWRKILKWKCNKLWEGGNSTVSEKPKQRNVREMRLGAVLAPSHASPTVPEAQNSWTNGSSIFQSSFPMLKFHRYWYLHQLDESQFRFIYLCCNHASVCSFKVSQIQQQQKKRT